MLFLMLCYVDRVVFCSRSFTRSFPTLRGWSCVEMRRRVKGELKAKKFGLGYVENQINKDNVDFSEANDNSKGRLGARVGTSDISSNSKLVAVEKVSSLAKRIINNFVEWEEAMSQLKSLYLSSNAVTRMQKTATEVFASYATNSQELEVDLDISKSNFLSQSQEIYEDATFLEEIAKIERDFLNAKENMKNDQEETEVYVGGKESSVHGIEKNLNESDFSVKVVKGKRTKRSKVKFVQKRQQCAVVEKDIPPKKKSMVDFNLPSFSIGLTQELDYAKEQVEKADFVRYFTPPTFRIDVSQEADFAFVRSIAQEVSFPVNNEEDVEVDGVGERHLE